jgi:hypothetical protein
MLPWRVHRVTTPPMGTVRAREAFIGRLRAGLMLAMACLAGLGGMPISSAVAAPVAQSIKAANWSGGAVLKGQQVDGCAATAANAKGMAITYTMNRQLRWNLSISNPDWSLTNGFSLSINLDIDGRRFRGRATVIRNSGLQIEVDDRIGLFATLRISGQLRATAGGLSMEFDLTNSSEALSAVAQCALKQTMGVAASASRNPGAKGKAALPEPPRDAATHKEIVDFATAIRSFSGLGGFRLVQASESMPGSLAAVGWTAEAAAGVVMLLPASEAPKSGDAARRAIQYEQRKCRGEYFFAEDAAVQDRTEIARVYVTCKMPESTAIAYYTAVPRPKGGAYVITSTSGQGFVMVLQKQTEAADARLRVAILEALKRFDADAAQSGREEPAANSDRMPER